MHTEANPDKTSKVPSRKIYNVWGISLFIFFTLAYLVSANKATDYLAIIDGSCTSPSAVMGGKKEVFYRQLEIPDDTHAVIILGKFPVLRDEDSCKIYHLEDGKSIDIGVYSIKGSGDIISVDDKINIHPGENWEGKRLSKIGVAWIYFDELRLWNVGISKGGKGVEFSREVLAGFGYRYTPETPNWLTISILLLSLAISILLSIYLGIKYTYHLGKRVIARFRAT
ncbi:MAG: hypothetical protein OEZ02_01800 [Anaerolineae bacterium]|nr:hypothetical protein [Anaerolineae bacterium]